MRYILNNSLDEELQDIRGQAQVCHVEKYMPSYKQ